MHYFAEFYTLVWMIEEFFENKRFALNIERMKHIQKFGYSGLELEHEDPDIRDILNDDENIDNEMDLGILETMGIQIFRKYLFIAIYQTFERVLISYCERAKDKLNLLTSYNDILGKSCIDKCRIYLLETAKIKIPSDQIWEHIAMYNELRNCIVHYGGNIYVNQKRWDRLRKYIKRTPLLYLYDDVYEDNKELFEYGEWCSEISSFEILLEKGFCEEALGNFDLYMNDLDDQLKDL